jgi:hypothetical protein
VADGAGGVARAGDDAVSDAARAASTAADLALGVIDRTRRAIAIGPHVGGLVAEGAAEPALTVGLGLYTFAIPSALDLRELIEERIRHRVEERVKALVAGGQPPGDLVALAREVATEVVAELRGEAVVRHLLDKPKLGVIVEGVLPSGGGSIGRVGISRGVGRVSLGASAGVGRAAGVTTTYLGVETSLRLTPIGEARTPVLEIYARFDVGFHDGAHAIGLLGARVLLDLL